MVVMMNIQKEAKKFINGHFEFTQVDSESIILRGTDFTSEDYKQMDLAFPDFYFVGVKAAGKKISVFYKGRLQ